MRGLAAADPGGDGGDHPVADLVQVDDIGAVEHRQMHDKARGTVQFMQQRCGRAVQPVLVHRKRSQLDQPHAEFVVAPAAAQPAQLDQSLEHPVGRGAGQPGAPDDLRQGQTPRPVEGIQDQRDPVDDGAGRVDLLNGRVSWGLHGVICLSGICLLGI